MALKAIHIVFSMIRYHWYIHYRAKFLCRNAICWFLKRNHFHGTLWKVSFFRYFCESYRNGNIAAKVFSQLSISAYLCDNKIHVFDIIFNGIHCQSHLLKTSKTLMQSSCTELFSCSSRWSAIQRYWIYNALHSLLSILWIDLWKYCKSISKIVLNEWTQRLATKDDTNKQNKVKVEEDNANEIGDQYKIVIHLL